MADLAFELVTPERLVRSGPVHMVVVPGTEGDFAVLAGHAPMMSTIREGELAVHTAPGTPPDLITISGGFADVTAAGLTILAERAEPVTGH